MAVLTKVSVNTMFPNGNYAAKSYSWTAFWSKNA